MLAPDAEIRAFLGRVGSPPGDQLDELVSRGRRLVLAKNEPLVRIGEANHRLAFIHGGILRYHVVTPDGLDVTKDFGFPRSFAVSFGSAVQGKPARVAITAVEESVLTIWPFGDFVAFAERDVEWQKIARRLAEALYVRKEDRELSFLLQDARARYEAALVMFPPELSRVPQHMLASYLGVTPESLSRLKRRAKARV